MKIILLVRREKSDLALNLVILLLVLIFLKNMNLMVEKALKALQMNLKHFWESVQVFISLLALNSVWVGI